MDEAERCHSLAILDRGALVASGSPRRLMQEIAETVLEIEAADLRAARAVLTDLDAVASVAQLGTRLHALVDAALERPAEKVRGALAGAGVDAAVEVVQASLEDVFVSVTRQRSAERAP
jgi:ABC-2 type transport system ATP-binding protein